MQQELERCLDDDAIVLWHLRVRSGAQDPDVLCAARRLLGQHHEDTRLLESGGHHSEFLPAATVRDPRERRAAKRCARAARPPPIECGIPR